MLNTSIGAFQKDTCATCDELNVKINDSPESEEERIKSIDKSICVNHSSSTQNYAQVLIWLTKIITFCVYHSILSRIYHFHTSLQMILIFFTYVNSGYMFSEYMTVVRILAQCMPGPSQ